MRALGFLIFTVVAMGTGCGADKCRKSGDACAQAEDCCDGLACFDGKCGAPVATCPDEAPLDCGSILPGMCCPSDTPNCCKDGNCYAKATDCGKPSCASEFKSCSASANCCSGFTCSRFGHICHAAKKLALGDACTAQSQCSSMWCSSYCTQRCAKNSECGSANNCLDTADGPMCVPFCSTNADCSVFGAGVTCQASTDPAGLTLKGCFSE